MNSRQRLSILRGGKDISATNATPLRLGEKVARRIPAIVVTGLLQNEGNGLRDFASAAVRRFIILTIDTDFPKSKGAMYRALSSGE